MRTNRRITIRSAAALVACAGLVYVSTQMEPQSAKAFGPAETFYNSGYQQHVGRQVIPVTLKRFDFANADDGGHPDFGKKPDAGAGRYAKIASDSLDADRRPAFNSTGFKVLQDATDARGNAMAPSNANVGSEPGDSAGSLDGAPGGAVTSQNSFEQWFEPTPGVNQWSDDTVNFMMNNDGAYVLEGSLDSMGTGQATDYTASMGWSFVHEAERDSFLEIETDAEAWVYIDGKLVIDGGGLGEAIDFEIIDSVVVPNQPYSAEIQVLGSAIYSGSYHRPITIRADIGGDLIDPFGSFTSPTGSNVNDDQSATGHMNPGDNPRTYTVPNTYDAGTPISVRGRSWKKKSTSYNGGSDSHWTTHRDYETASNSQQIYVLRNGDDVPDIEGIYGQDDVSKFVGGFTDEDTGTIVLQDNQIIYLYELGTDYYRSSADFQDLVALVTLSADGGTTTNTTVTTGTTNTTAPRLTQRIDLSRLDWLDDRTPYRVEVFYANRTGAASDIRIETNLRTMNVIAHPMAYVAD